MVDIARVFSPFVVFASGESRPQTSDRIRNASAKRISSSNTHRSSRIASAVSTIENNTVTRDYFASDAISDEKTLETELEQQLSTPLTGINLRELINEKISNLDRALRSIEAPSDVKKTQASIDSERFRVAAIQDGKSRQQVQDFAGLLTSKSNSQDLSSVPLQTKGHAGAFNEQDQSTLLEIFQYPGFEEQRVTPLPFHVSLGRQVMQRILPKQYILSKHAPHTKPLIELYYSIPTQSLILDIFWWLFLDKYQNQPEIQARLQARASNSYVAALMMQIDLRYRDKCFQVYPSLLAETVFACFKVCFPASIKQMPPDADAAGERGSLGTRHLSNKLQTTSDASTSRMKELLTLDSFKNSISNLCQLWLGGIPAPPRRYEQWRSKLIQQEKISFDESSPSIDGKATARTPDSKHGSSTQSFAHRSRMNGRQAPSADSLLSRRPQISSKRNKHQKPSELLNNMYKHTHDALPDRRVHFEDYLFDLNGYSPLTEKFLRSSGMMRQAGTQLFIPHPQISQVPTVNVETYNDEIKRAARICRLLRAQKHMKQAQQHARIVQQQAIPSNRTEKVDRQKNNSTYPSTLSDTRHGRCESISELSFKTHP